MSQPLILGMDGGGTVTTTWLATADGTVVGRGRSGPSNIKAVGAKAAMTSLDLSILDAFRDAGQEVRRVEVSCLGLAGFDRPEDKDWLHEWAEGAAWAGRLVLVNDGDLVVAAGTAEGWGVAVISGTGSIAVGRDAEGRAARSGGWGYVFGDEGSAFNVAVAALRLVARRADGRDAPPVGRDHLTERLLSSLGLSAPGDLIHSIYSGGMDRARIASIAPAVVAASGDDPRIVATILEPAGLELASMVAAVARQLGWSEGPLPLAMAGGFLLGTPDLSRALLGNLESLGYRVEATAVAEPVAGALVLAGRALER